MDLLVAQDLHHLGDLVAAGDSPQPDLIGLVRGDEDAQPRVQPLQHVEALDLPVYFLLLDPDDLGDALGRVDRLVSNFEFGSHGVDLLWGS